MSFINTSQLTRELAFAKQAGFLEIFEEASTLTGVPLEILLAVSSRESALGTSPLLVNWIGDNGFAWGLMQIDRRWHPQFTNNHSPDDHNANIFYSAGYLLGHYKRFNDWRTAAAAYNAGAGAVSSAIRSGRDPDSVTTGGNYGADVIYRSKFFKSKTNTRFLLTNILTLSTVFLAYHMLKN
ncbi:MAG: transglycosylase SLT domain-containing protein [Balneolales bacterium]|nr:transglycosylase SLT domain-containing protein [Balneolales bacterium]